MNKKKRRLEDCPNQRSILCPWQKAKKRKKMLTVFGQPMTATLRLPVAHSFLLRYSRGYSWHERTWGLIWKWREDAKQTVTAPLFSPNAQKPVKMEVFGGRAGMLESKAACITCVPDCFPVVSDGCCLVALIGQVFANVVVNLKA